MTDRTTLENALRKDLFMIVLLWDELLTLPRAPTTHTTHHEAPLPIPVAVLSLRREAGEQLAAWAHLVYDERQLNTGLDLMNVVGVCRFLTTHAQFLACHEAARDAAGEIRAIAANITELVRQTRARRLRLGKCPKNNDRGGPCPGELVAFVRNTDALLPSEVRCSADQDHHWRAGEWRLLGALVWENECNETARRANARRPLPTH